MNKLLRILYSFRRGITIKTKGKLFILHNLIILVVFTFLYRFIALNYGNDKEKKLFSNLENSFYYTTVTQFGVGYGDIVPESKIMKRFCIAHVLLVFLIILY